METKDSVHRAAAIMVADSKSVSWEPLLLSSPEPESESEHQDDIVSPSFEVTPSTLHTNKWPKEICRARQLQR